MRSDTSTRPAAVIAGVGGHLPSTVVTNTELSTRFDTTDEWITSRTGIMTRHRVEPGIATSDLAVTAARHALASAGSIVDSIDLVVLATATPDHPCPATAPVVALRLGFAGVPAFDVAAVCSGFVYALAVAEGMITAGTAHRALVIGADAFSTILNPDDRTTVAVFGDGAGAVILRSGEPDEPGALLGFDLGSDGALADLIMVRTGGSRHPGRVGMADADNWFAMQGQAVYRHAIVRMTASARHVMARAGWTAENVDWFVAHQANARILAAVGANLDIPPDRVYANLGEVGNTAGASIPLALAQATAAGRLRPGNRVLLTAFGGGATWGSVALTWPDLKWHGEGVNSHGHRADARGGKPVRA